MTQITEDDLQDALRDQMRAAHAEIEAEYQKNDEISVDDYAKEFGFDHSKAARELELLEANRKVTKRTGITTSGKRGKLYKFVAVKA